MPDVVELESGTGLGYRAEVASDGAVRTFPAMSPVATSPVTVMTGAMELLGAREHRRQIQIQNLSDTNAVHVRLASGAATTSDYRSDPGAVYLFPPGVSYEGEIWAIAVGASVAVVCIEFFE